MTALTRHPLPPVERSPLDGSTLDSMPAAPQHAAPVSFEQTLADHHAAVRRLVFRLLAWSKDAEDVTQEVFLTAWRAWPRFRGECTPRTWLTRIAVNGCRSHRRKQLLGFGLLSKLRGRPTPESPDASHPAIDRETAEQVREAVSRLRAADREVIVLHYLEQLSVTQVMETLELPRGTIEVRLSRARGRLRGLLERSQGPKSADNKKVDKPTRQEPGR